MTRHKKMIDESMIRYWRKKKDVMTKLPKRQRTCPTGIANFPALERTLKEWIIGQRENSRAVTTIMIRLKAKELAKQMNVAEFVGGPSWCSRFMCRNHLSVRSSICFMKKGGACHRSRPCFQHG